MTTKPTNAASAGYGRRVAPDTLRFERTLPGPIERVWAYLTETDRLARWLAAGDIELREGGRVELRFRHADLSPHPDEVPAKWAQLADGVTLHARVTACAPPRLLAYTWPESASDESEVTFELHPNDDGTVRLTLTHRRLADRATLLDVAGGWHTHLDILGDVLDGHVPPPFWSANARWEEEYARRIPGNVKRET